MSKTKVTIKYPTEWSLGKPRGSIKVVKDGYQVLITPPNEKQIVETFNIKKFNGNKEETLTRAHEFMKKTSDDKGLTRNRIRYINEDTIEVEVSDDKIMKTDAIFIEFVEKYPLCIKTKKNKDGTEKYYVLSQDIKKQFNFTSLICDYGTVGYKNGNSLDIRYDNLINLSKVNKINDDDDIFDVEKEKSKIARKHGRIVIIDDTKDNKEIMRKEEKKNINIDIVENSDDIDEIDEIDEIDDDLDDELYDENNIPKGYKKCKTLTCGEIKKITSFSIDRNMADGHKNTCKKCCSIKSKEFRDNNKDHVSDYNKKYREENKEKVQSYYKLTEEEKETNKATRRLEFGNKFKELVQQKGGTMISDPSEYINAHDKLEVECKNKHIFAICYNNCCENRWCPMCNLHIGEMISKCAIEHITGEKFEKIRPSWLKSPKSNSNLELDMYNDDMKLAVEYDGIQHDQYIQHFHRTEENFKKRQEDDKLKDELCKIKGVTLIRIPHTVKHEDICSYLIDQLIKKGFTDTNKDKVNTFEMTNIYDYESKTEELKKIINENNGKLIDGVYLSRDSLLTIECEEKHQWNTKVKTILRGCWCTTCGFKVEDTTKSKISNTLKKFNQSAKGKALKQTSHEKRSETMKHERQEVRANITEKKCNTCEEIKLIDCYSKKSAAKDGLQSNCRVCVNEIKKQHRSGNKVILSEEKV